MDTAAEGGRAHPDRRSAQPAELSTAQRFAIDIEAAFLGIDRTLTDDNTAAVYRRTLDVVARALEGAEATGIIGARELAGLSDLLKGMQAAPSLL